MTQIISSPTISEVAPNEGSYKNMFCLHDKMVLKNTRSSLMYVKKWETSSTFYDLTTMAMPFAVFLVFSADVKSFVLDYVVCSKTYAARSFTP